MPSKKTSTTNILMNDGQVSNIAPLLSRGREIILAMADLQERISGLAFTPKKFREERQNKMVDEWNKLVEELEQIQNTLPPDKDVKQKQPPVDTGKKSSGRGPRKSKGNK